MKNRKLWKIEKIRVKNVENLEKKLSDKNDPYTTGSFLSESFLSHNIQFFFAQFVNLPDFPDFSPQICEIQQTRFFSFGEFHE